VTFTLRPGDLASFDTGRAAWVAQPGQYTVKIGASAGAAGAEAAFQLPHELVVERVHHALVPRGTIQERSSAGR
jgi:beta-glucosidase